LACKFLSLLFLKRPFVFKRILTFISIDDESALRAKVDEALHVYDEYMKNKGSDEPADAKPKEAAKEGSEENKS
jgi:hypothetical protein